MNIRVKVAFLHGDVLLLRGLLFETADTLRSYHNVAVSLVAKLRQKRPWYSWISRRLLANEVAEMLEKFKELESEFQDMEAFANERGLPMSEVGRRQALEEETREKILKSGDTEYLLRLDAVFEEGVAIL